MRNKTRASASADSAEVPVIAGDGQEPDSDAVVRRTKDGWRVGDSDVPDLTSAMALADLLAADPAAAPPPAGPDAESTAGETGKLRATVRQLEHALRARIRIEQAIG